MAMMVEYSILLLLVSVLIGLGTTAAYLQWNRSRPHTLFVDKFNGANEHAVRGSSIFNYRTIQAALDAARTDDTIWVSPGTYTEDLTWPDTDITLKGAGPTSTVLVNSTDVDTIRIVPTVDLKQASILDIAITNSGDNLGVNVNGVYGTFRMSNVLMPSGGVTMQVVGAYDFRNIQAGEVDLTATDCGTGVSVDSTWNNVTIYNDPTLNDQLAKIALLEERQRGYEREYELLKQLREATVQVISLTAVEEHSKRDLAELSYLRQVTADASERGIHLDNGRSVKCGKCGEVATGVCTHMAFGDEPGDEQGA